MTPPTYSRDEILLSIEGVSHTFGPLEALRDINVQIRNLHSSDGEATSRQPGQVVAFLGPSGCGKCLAPGTPVLMYSGHIRPVEEIHEGDLVMGPTGEPKQVLGTTRGYDNMYQITPTKGAPFTVNSHHILSLKYPKHQRSKARTKNISVTDYLNGSKSLRTGTLYRSDGIDFPSQEVPIDPYIFGVWLGDGDSKTGVFTTADPEIVIALGEYAESTGARVTVMHHSRPNKSSRYNINNRWKNPETSLHVTLRRLGVMNNKHIPDVYKLNTKAVRLELLAGLLDSDGHLYGNCYDFIAKNKSISQDLMFIARSVGLAAYIKECTKRSQNGTVGIYHRVIISGDTDMIPCRIAKKKAQPRRQCKNALHTGFTVKDVGIGEYFGFQVDGDGLFLLGDFTVTHNSVMLKIIAGLLAPTVGCVKIDPDAKPIKRGMTGVVFQKYPLFCHRTVFGNLTLAGEMAGMTYLGAKEKADYYLDLFELSTASDKYPVELSGGMQQRVAISQQLMNMDGQSATYTRLMLMDEPFAALDHRNTRKTCQLIRRVADLHDTNTIIVVTHDISAALCIGDIVWVMGRDRDKDGKVCSGGKIVKEFDLINAGLTWQPEIDTLPAFAELRRELAGMFQTL